MAFEYTDLNTIHDPAAGTTPPASWGDQVRDNLERAVKPYHARVDLTAAQSTASGALHAITWPSKKYDTSPNNDLWLASRPDRFVIPITGLWRVTFNAQFATNATGIRIVYINVTEAGTGRVLAVLPLTADGVFIKGGNVSGEDRLAAGTIVQAMVYQNSGAALNVSLDYPVWATCSLVSR